MLALRRHGHFPFQELKVFMEAPCSFRGTLSNEGLTSDVTAPSTPTDISLHLLTQASGFLLPTPEGISEGPLGTEIFQNFP